MKWHIQVVPKIIRQSRKEVVALGTWYLYRGSKNLIRATLAMALPPPGPKMPQEGMPLSRSPPAADKYLHKWNDMNYFSGHLAETERLAAERLLQETHDLINNAKYKTRQDEKEVDTRFRQRVGDIAFWKAELEGKLATLKEAVDGVESQHVRTEQALGKKFNFILCPKKWIFQGLSISYIYMLCHCFLRVYFSYCCVR